MQRTPETVKSVIIADKQSKSFCIALSVLKNTFDKDVITKALIDSGASINCLDWGFVKKHKIPYHRLPQPIRARNVDGSDNESGVIKFIATMLMSLLMRYTHIPFYFRFSFTFPTSPIHLMHLRSDVTALALARQSHSLYQTDLAYLMDI